MTWIEPVIDWNTGNLVSADDLNDIGKNLKALWDRAGNLVSYKTLGNLTTSAGSFVNLDATNLSLDITVESTTILVGLSGYGRTTGGDRSDFTIAIDDVEQTRCAVTWGTDESTITFVVPVTVTPGTVNVKLKGRNVGGGTLTLYAEARFWVMEV